jgi:hypothetical protein
LLGRVPTTANTHLLVNFPPLFAEIPLLAAGKRHPFRLNWQKISSKSGY